MRIFGAGVATESNSFSPIATRLEDFRVLRGCDVAAGRTDPGLNLGDTWGRQAAERGDQFIFSLNAWAEPAGITVREAYERLRDEMLSDLQAAMPVDVVLLMLHGAMLAEGYDDCEEDMVRRVREIVGRDAVIGVELDLHCHLSERKLAPVDIVVTFKEYPHVDINDRARELFALAVATRLGHIRPTMALFDCQMIGLYPTSREPLRGFVEAMMAATRRKGVLSMSFGHGFQFADVPWMGSKMLVVTDDDLHLAQEVAREFGLMAYRLRHEIGFERLSLSLDAALSRALLDARRPVVVADQSDNTGAGAPGDSTFALRWLLDHHAEDVGLATFYDPEAVRLAKSAGPGGKVSVSLGGKLSTASGRPLDLEVEVLATRDDYMHARPQLSGKKLWRALGDVAALRCGTIDIVVTSRRGQCFCPSIFTDLGIDPTTKRLLVIKSMQHFHLAFAPLAGEILYMSAPGACPPDPRQIAYGRVDTSRLYPWVDDPLAT